jgi:hypothetical protein
MPLDMLTMRGERPLRQHLHKMQRPERMVSSVSRTVARPTLSAGASPLAIMPALLIRTVDAAAALLEKIARAFEALAVGHVERVEQGGVLAPRATPEPLRPRRAFAPSAPRAHRAS